MEEVSFEKDVVPLLRRKCMICHLPGDEQGGLSLLPDTYINLVKVSSTQSPLLLVKPGMIEQSYLYHKLKGTHQAVGGSGDRMPYQRDSLDESQVQIVRGWIEQGAKRN